MCYHPLAGRLRALKASSGTASAHTASASNAASCQPPFCIPIVSTPPPPPHIAVYNEQWIGGNCRWMLVVGYGFVPGHVTLYAYYKNYFYDQLQVSPYSFTADNVGDIHGGITICGAGMGDQVIYTQVGNGYSSQLYRQNHLVAYEWNGGVYSKTYTV